MTLEISALQLVELLKKCPPYPAPHPQCKCVLVYSEQARSRGMRSSGINIYLLSHNRTQKEIAEYLGLDKSTVSLMLSGKLRLEHRLDQIADYLSISRRKLDRLIQSNGGANGDRN